MTKKAQEYLEGWKRCKADFLNFKKEVEHKQKDWKDLGRGEVISKILPILDGLELLTKEIKRCLNIKAVPTKKFNPEIHEAIAGQGDKIEQVLQKGYFLNTKLLRPARVKLK
ncbi:MAG: nucleotide exchange factor GrpE [bacterium]